MNELGNPQQPPIHHASASSAPQGSKAELEAELHILRQRVEEQEWTLKQLDDIVAEFYGVYPEHTQAVPIVRPGENPLIATIRCVVRSLERQSKTYRSVSDRARQLSDSKDAFLASISSELSAPLSGMLGLVNQVLATELPKEQQSQLMTVRHSAESLLKTLSDVFDYSKVCAQQVELEARPFSPREVVEEALQVFGPIAREKGLAVHHYIDDRTPDQVIGDDVRVRQVLWAFVNNSIKLTDEGSLAISLNAASVNGQWDLWFQVKDSGRGLSEDQMSNLLSHGANDDPFAAQLGGGAGLGIAISKSLVELMGGRIDAKSEPGAGCTFRFSLRLDSVQSYRSAEPAPGIRPMAPPTKSNGAPSGNGSHSNNGRGTTPVTANSAERKRKVLLVEDNDLNRAVARLSLEKLGCRVDVAKDGTEAVEAARSEIYEIICMDLNLPDFDGLEATRRIRQLTSPSADAKIIATTGHTFHEDRRLCMEAGMDEFLSKPFDIAQLHEAIDRACSMQRLPSHHTERVFLYAPPS